MPIGYVRAVTSARQVPFADVLTDPGQLARLYRPPHERIARKKIDHIDDGARALIAASSFLLLATADAEGRCAVSPKGGPAGFVAVLDRHRLAIPDVAGNNLLDSLRHLLANPHVGLMFLLPGHEQILRVEGRAWVTTDGSVLDRFGDSGQRPKVAIGVAVASAFVHCPASLRRGRLWDPDAWAGTSAPSMDEVLGGHLDITRPAEG